MRTSFLFVPQRYIYLLYSWNFWIIKDFLKSFTRHLQNNHPLVFCSIVRKKLGCWKKVKVSKRHSKVQLNFIDFDFFSLSSRTHLDVPNLLLNVCLKFSLLFLYFRYSHDDSPTKNFFPSFCQRLQGDCF